MNLFKTKAHKAEVTHDLAKISKERMINRVSGISNALKASPDMPKQKVEKLKIELKHILMELDARDDAVKSIMDNL